MRGSRCFSLACIKSLMLSIIASWIDRSSIDPSRIFARVDEKISTEPSVKGTRRKGMGRRGRRSEDRRPIVGDHWQVKNSRRLSKSSSQFYSNASNNNDKMLRTRNIRRVRVSPRLRPRRSLTRRRRLISRGGRRRGRWLIAAAAVAAWPFLGRNGPSRETVISLAYARVARGTFFSGEGRGWKEEEGWNKNEVRTGEGSPPPRGDVAWLASS